MGKGKKKTIESIVAVKKRGNKVVSIVKDEKGRITARVEVRNGRHHGHVYYTIKDKVELREYKNRLLKKV